MKKSSWPLILTIYLLAGLLALSGCAKNDSGGGGGGGGGTEAQTPCNSPAGTCTPGAYNQQPGLMVPAPQAYNNGMNNGYCGCQQDYRPIYNPQWGFACAPANYLQYSSYMGYNYNSIYQGPDQVYGTTTIQQIYYTPASYGGNSGACYNNFAASCDVRVANSCSGGGTCRAIGGGSTIGVCTLGNGVDNYNSPSAPGVYYGGGYGYNGGVYSSGGTQCTVKTNSWGLTYYYCYPANNSATNGIPR